MLLLESRDRLVSTVWKLGVTRLETQKYLPI